jgi:two-component system response regulator FixJ
MLVTMTHSSQTNSTGITSGQGFSMGQAESITLQGTQTWTIYLVHPSSIERRRLSAVLESTRFAVQEFSSAGDLLNAVTDNPNVCLLCDSDLGGTSGLHLLAQLHAAGRVIPSVMLISPGDVLGAVAAMKAGVGEVVVKPVEPGELLHAVRGVIDSARGSGATRESVADLLRRQAKLSTRELTVFRLITRGLSNKQAAVEMSLAVKTIEIHRANVMKKMQAENLPELVRQAVVLEGVPTPLNDSTLLSRRR